MKCSWWNGERLLTKLKSSKNESSHIIMYYSSSPPYKCGPVTLFQINSENLEYLTFSETSTENEQQFKK